MNGSTRDPTAIVTEDHAGDVLVVGILRELVEVPLVEEPFPFQSSGYDQEDQAERDGNERHERFLVSHDLYRNAKNLVRTRNRPRLPFRLHFPPERTPLPGKLTDPDCLQ